MEVFMHWVCCIAVLVGLLFLLLSIVLRAIEFFIGRVFKMPFIKTEPDKKRNFTESVVPLTQMMNQEDVSTRQTRKSINKIFEQQKQSMDARALKAHDARCKDIWLCNKEICFVATADKIVSQSTVPRKTDTERRATAKNGEVKIKSNLNRLKYGLTDKK